MNCQLIQTGDKDQDNGVIDVIVGDIVSVGGGVIATRIFEKAVLLVRLLSEAFVRLTLNLVVNQDAAGFGRRVTKKVSSTKESILVVLLHVTVAQDSAQQDHQFDVKGVNGQEIKAQE